MNVFWIIGWSLLALFGFPLLMASLGLILQRRNTRLNDALNNVNEHLQYDQEAMSKLTKD